MVWLRTARSRSPQAGFCISILAVAWPSTESRPYSRSALSTRCILSSLLMTSPSSSPLALLQTRHTITTRCWLAHQTACST